MLKDREIPSLIKDGTKTSFTLVVSSRAKKDALKKHSCTQQVAFGPTMTPVVTFSVTLHLLISLSIVQSASWFGAHFECTGRNRCYDDQIHCYDDQNCIVHCSGDNSCQYSVIHCPVNGHCTVTCSGGLDACKDVVFLAKHSLSLSIACDAAEDEACDEMVVYCPDNGAGGPAACQIGGVSANNVKTKMEVQIHLSIIIHIHISSLRN